VYGFGIRHREEIKETKGISRRCGILGDSTTTLDAKEQYDEPKAKYDAESATIETTVHMGINMADTVGDSLRSAIGTLLFPGVGTVFEAFIGGMIGFFTDSMVNNLYDEAAPSK